MIDSISEMKTGESPRRPKPSRSLWNEVQMPLSGIFLSYQKVPLLPYQGSTASLHFSFSLSFFLFLFPLLCSAQPRLVHAPVLRDTQCSGLLSGQGLHTHHLYAPRRHDALSRRVWRMCLLLFEESQVRQPWPDLSIRVLISTYLNRIPCLVLI